MVWEAKPLSDQSRSRKRCCHRSGNNHDTGDGKIVGNAKKKSL